MQPPITLYVVTVLAVSLWLRAAYKVRQERQNRHRRTGPRFDRYGTIITTKVLS